MTSRLVVICTGWAVNLQLPVKTRTAPITRRLTRTLADVIGPPSIGYLSVDQGTTPTTTGNPYYR